MNKYTIYDVRFTKFATLEDASLRDEFSRRHQVSASVAAESADAAKALIERNWAAYAARAVEATERPSPEEVATILIGPHPSAYIDDDARIRVTGGVYLQTQYGVVPWALPTNLRQVPFPVRHIVDPVDPAVVMPSLGMLGRISLYDDGHHGVAVEGGPNDSYLRIFRLTAGQRRRFDRFLPTGYSGDVTLMEGEEPLVMTTSAVA